MVLNSYSVIRLALYVYTELSWTKGPSRRLSDCCNMTLSDLLGRQPCPVRIPARLPSVMAEFRDFPESLGANIGLVLSNRPQRLPVHIVLHNRFVISSDTAKFSQFDTDSIEVSPFVI
jgi:hypothetical protein